MKLITMLIELLQRQCSRKKNIIAVTKGWGPETPSIKRSAYGGSFQFGGTQFVFVFWKIYHNRWFFFLFKYRELYQYTHSSLNFLVFGNLEANFESSGFRYSYPVSRLSFIILNWQNIKFDQNITQQWN